MIEPIRESIQTALVRAFEGITDESELAKTEEGLRYGMRWERVTTNDFTDADIKKKSVLGIFSGPEFYVAGAGWTIANWTVMFEFLLYVDKTERQSTQLNRWVMEIYRFLRANYRIDDLTIDIVPQRSEVVINPEGDNQCRGMLEAQISYRFMESDPRINL